MKKIIGLMLLVNAMFAQTSDWSLEINYPLVIDQNFVGQNFDGLAELGLSYRLHEDLHYNLSATLHNSLLKDRSQIEDVITDFNVLLWFVQPRLKADFIFDSLPNVHPYVGVGYSFVRSFTNGNVGTFFPQGGNTRSGINAIAGVTVDVSSQWYINAGYDFVRLSKVGTIANPFLQNINTIKLGAGYRF